MKPILISLLLLNLLPAGVHAAPGEPEKERAKPETDRRPGDARKGRGPRPPQDRDQGELWKGADRDGDGRISLGEFAQMQRIRELPEDKRDRLFARLDTDGNGFLEGEELAHHRRPGGQGPGFGMKRLWELDLDKSGGVGFEEFEQGEFFKKLPAEKRREIFNRLDTNGDGQLSPEDRPQPPRGRRGNRPPPPAEMFRQFDADQDGRLSFGEFRRMPAPRDLGEDEQEDRFEAMDTNGDGFLSPEELMPPRGQGRRADGESPED